MPIYVVINEVVTMTKMFIYPVYRWDRDFIFLHRSTAHRRRAFVYTGVEEWDGMVICAQGCLLYWNALKAVRRILDSLHDKFLF